VKTLSLLAASFLLASCAATRAPDPFPPESRTAAGTRMIELMGSFVTGSFDSIPQGRGEGDSTLVKLHTVRLWPERQGEFWFYSEFARVGSENAPFLQRIFRMGEADGDILEIHYEVPGDGKQLVGEWRKPAPMQGIDPATLKERPGCRMHLSYGHLTLYNGGTIGKECAGRVPGVAYEVSDFFLTSSSIRLWDRGYDASGKVVWGNPDGPLEFRKMSQALR
jgi:CpeT protein